MKKLIVSALMLLLVHLVSAQPEVLADLSAQFRAEAALVLTNPLSVGLKSGTLSDISNALAKGPEFLNRRDLKGMTPLWHAAAVGNVLAFETLLRAGANPHIRVWSGQTLEAFLELTASKRNPETNQVLSTLLSQHLKTPPAYTSNDLARLRLENNAAVMADLAYSLQKRRDSDQRQALSEALVYAAGTGSERACVLLLKAGADPSWRDKEGKTALEQLGAGAKLDPSTSNRIRLLLSK